MMLKQAIATSIVSYLCSGSALAASDKVDAKISALTDEIEASYRQFTTRKTKRMLN